MLKTTDAVVEKVTAQERQWPDFIKRTTDRHFVEDNLVSVKDFRSHRKYDWVPSKLIKVVGKQIWIVLFLINYGNVMLTN